MRPPPGEIVNDDCVPSDTTLCLSNSRFKVEAVWEDTPGEAMVPAQVSRTSDNGGALMFMDSITSEVLNTAIVSLLDACKANNNYWTFAAAMTDVPFELTVTNTNSGDVQTYPVPIAPGLPPLVVDTQAFATCPE